MPIEGGAEFVHGRPPVLLELAGNERREVEGSQYLTGLRKAGREVTRSKDASDRSVYRLVTLKAAGER